MFDWPGLLCTAKPRDDDEHLPTWFGRIAERLLNGSRLRAGSKSYRLVEVEFYYHWSGHADPFCHRDPVEVEGGRWYFHRSHGIYRGGSFKGVDVTFGGGGTHAGILFRGAETENGTLIDGPSLLVDHLLAVTGQPDVATFDALTAGRKTWDPENPLKLETAPLEQRPILRTGRVGLSLKFMGRQPARTAIRLAALSFSHRAQAHRQGQAAHGHGALPTGLERGRYLPAHRLPAQDGSALYFRLRGG